MQDPARFPTCAWISDPHFNFVPLSDWEILVEQITSSQAQAILITGDISESEDVAWQLERLQSACEKPIYFVLGNHDFYHGSIKGTRRGVEELCQARDGLHFLTGSQPIRLDDSWTLCGDDGWADGRIGDYFRSPVRMNDFVLIDELTNLDDLSRWKRLKREGTESALRLRRQLEAARQVSQNSIVLTHVPPFREACWYQGSHSNDDWAPFFASYVMGWMLKRFCQRYPEHSILVLCGHTHSEGKSRILNNLTVWTAGAEYGEPTIAEMITLGKASAPAYEWCHDDLNSGSN
ncbi:MAG: metallophosphoesterase [Planctomycetota bacterium]